MTSDEKLIGKSGLCADCLHAKKIVSGKGSEFLLCELSKTDPRFTRYPRLPVLSCTGYQSGSPNEPAQPAKHP